MQHTDESGTVLFYTHACEHKHIIISYYTPIRLSTPWSTTQYTTLAMHKHNILKNKQYHWYKYLPHLI